MLLDDFIRAWPLERERGLELGPANKCPACAMQQATAAASPRVAPSRL